MSSLCRSSKTRTADFCTAAVADVDGLSANVASQETDSKNGAEAEPEAVESF